VSSKKSILNIFLVSNPMVAIVAYEYIHEQSFKDDEVQIIFTHGFSSKLFSDMKAKSSYRGIFEKIGDRFSIKFLGYSAVDRRLMESQKNPFIFYSAWLDGISSELIKSNLCAGHIYMEEGDQTYKNFPLFSSSPSYKSIPRHKIGFHEATNYWRDDGLLWIGISEKSFPPVPDDKKYKIKSFENVKKKYSPFLMEYKNILLMPTPARLPKNEWKNAIVKLAESSNQPFALKLHPAFSYSPSVIKYFTKALVDLGFSESIVCNKETIIELEMMLDKKNLVGDRSSLSRYAEVFGSTFTKVPFLYGSFY